ncbi:MAG: NADH-quinone oxidoreductase subunit D [Bernardetiaceae bacterium]|nr:NADH-quinone oxidoreductase subunit D [Bernardetiaceae bacterium]
MQKVQYIYHKDNLHRSEPNKYDPDRLEAREMLLNIGPQHPSTHGVLRLEVITDGEQVVDVVPHIGYLHRCFEKHAEALSYPKIIPYVDRMDYAAAMNSEHAYALAIEKLLGITEKIPPRVEYIRVLVSELNRIASHFLWLGTYGLDVGAFTPFLWLMRDREHILRLLEWASGARLLYNYIWIGGLYYDIPIDFELRCLEFVAYLKPKLKEAESLITDNKIFINRTANIGVLPVAMAVNAGVTGPMLRGSGLAYDLRKADAYSVYPHLDFDIPVGKGEMGKTGDCWDRAFVRVRECYESLRLIEQCATALQKEYKRTRDFDPQALVPRRVKVPKGNSYFRAENPKGELGFFVQGTGTRDIPFRVKVRAPSFCNLSVLPHISKGALLADLMAIIGSIDIVLGEVDR